MRRSISFYEPDTALPLGDAAHLCRDARGVYFDRPERGRADVWVRCTQLIGGVVYVLLSTLSTSPVLVRREDWIAVAGFADLCCPRCRAEAVTDIGNGSARPGAYSPQHERSTAFAECARFHCSACNLTFMTF